MKNGGIRSFFWSAFYGLILQLRHFLSQTSAIGMLAQPLYFLAMLTRCIEVH